MSFAGTVRAIYLAAEHEAPLESVDAVDAIAGRGLVGDRYAVPNGESLAPARQLTLIAVEAIHAAMADLGEPIDAREIRRQVLVEGVPLNELVGVEFGVGPVRARGVELCEPCAHMQRLAGRPLLRPLVHRGGLNAEILQSGTIRVGDAVRPVRTVVT